MHVQLRSNLVRAARLRLVTLSLGMALGVIFGVYMLYRLGDWGLNRLLYENSAFALQTMDVQTDGVITPDQLRRWTGVATGVNLFALDLAEVKRNLEYAPFIAAASVERVLPNTHRSPRPSTSSSQPTSLSPLNTAVETISGPRRAPSRVTLPT